MLEVQYAHCLRVSLKYGNMQVLTADRVFRLVYNSRHNSLQAYVSLRPNIAATLWYTSNMAAVLM